MITLPKLTNATFQWAKAHPMTLLNKSTTYVPLQCHKSITMITFHLVDISSFHYLPKSLLRNFHFNVPSSNVCHLHNGNIVIGSSDWNSTTFSKLVYPTKIFKHSPLTVPNLPILTIKAFEAILLSRTSAIIINS